MGGGRRPGVGRASAGVGVGQASAGRASEHRRPHSGRASTGALGRASSWRVSAGVSTGGHTAGGRAPKGRPCATTEWRVAATRWMERPHRDALKRESTGIRGAPVCSASFAAGGSGKSAER
jgi:hypothetical protein